MSENLPKSYAMLKKAFEGDSEAGRQATGEDDRLNREKPPVSPMDGRVLRGKGRNVALNFRVTADFKRRFLAVAARKKMTMVDVLEAALAALEAGEKGK